MHGRFHHIGSLGVILECKINEIESFFRFFPSKQRIII